MATTFIYALCEPGTRTVRYIGKANNPEKRLKSHLTGSTKRENRLGRWLRSLEGRPNLVVLREVPAEVWQVAEERYIRLARGLGMDLTNATDGGEGLKNPTPETLEKMRQPKSEAHRRAFSRAQKGRPKTPAHKAAIRASNTARCAGRPASEGSKRGLLFGRMKRPGATSRFKGVHWDSSRRKWNTVVSIRGRAIRFGRFDNETDAARAYDAGAEKLLGPLAKLNFPI